MMNSFLVTIILISTVIYLIYLYYQRAFQYWSKRCIPHTKPSFPFGNFNSNMLKESGLIFQDIYNQMKKSGAKYTGCYMLTMPFFMPLNPVLYKDILIKNFQSFHDRGFYCDEEIDPLSANIITLQGIQWKYIRTKLTPAFSSLKLKTMFNVMKKCSTGIPDILEKSDKIEIHHLATGYAMDIICSSAFGIDGDNLKNPDTKFREYGKKLVIDISISDSIRIALDIMAPEISRTFKICLFNPKYTQFFHQVVQETIEFREKNNVTRNDLMDLLIRLKHNEKIDDNDTNDVTTNNDGKGLTVDQIAAQVLIFFLAGFETTAMAITFCLYELSRHPDIQHKVREEILNVLRENDGEITYEGVNNMPYTDKVIQETMRMHPPIVMINRVCTQRYHVPNTVCTLDVGTKVVISTLGVHHDPEFYPQPQRFDPERFSDEEKAKRPSVTYFPFGDGPRICLGLKFAMIEIKLVLIEFLKDFKFSVHPSTRSEIRTVTNTNFLGLKDKIWLKPTKINSNNDI